MRTKIFDDIIDYINSNIKHGIDYDETIDSFIEQLLEIKKEYKEGDR